ncbi:glycosyltransferase family 2 protein [Pantoea agglomerans]|nr:glycosyltransferase [Pantoea agglomerans]MBD8231585.1 glycosyltransferase [Pantoea agglomerans]
MLSPTTPARRAQRRSITSPQPPLIGIGVTTHNRHDMLNRTMAAIRRLAPEGARIVLVDDASDVPVKGATFRFEKNAGIARAKNKCFELLEDCEHIFLFDDDTYPLKTDWWKPYTDFGEPHLLYMFEHFATGRQLNDAALLYSDGHITAWSHGRGCMLYFSRRCLEVVGGMDPAFGKWGYEHVELSGRIYNAGLTSFKFMDVTDSHGLFWSADEHEAAASTVPGPQRRACLEQNRKIYARRQDSARFIPYRDGQQQPGRNDVVITSYFTGQPDPERGKTWEADYSQLEPLIRSLRGQPLVVLHDCFDVPDSAAVKHVRVNTSMPPYWQRWVSVYRYLLQHPEIERAFCVDATDVEMLRNPFPDMDDLIYCGDELTRMDDPWMVRKHPAATVQRFIREHASHPLLNAGLLGGSRPLLIRFIGALLDAWGKNVADVKFGRDKTVGHSDMGLFNQVLLTRFAGLVSHGEHVNTVFKKYEANDVSWWKHK